MSAIAHGPHGEAIAADYLAVRDGIVRCTLCAHLCAIEPGATGICRVRANRDGEAVLPHFGEASAVHVDPIEKKPLYHFHPGALVFSIGFLGCNFRCPFCQNSSISQSTALPTRHIEPLDLQRLVEESHSGARPMIGVAYTYNEPTIHYEYLLAATEVVSESGYANVLVTNGFLNRKPAAELLSRIDAVNVDLKSFSDDFYRDELGGGLRNVLDFIEIAAEHSHVEVTTLVIPGRTDDPQTVDQIASFLAQIDASIPLHLSAYHPSYRYRAPATPASTLLSLAERARERLEYVYPGNIAGTTATRCASCGATIVWRDGYQAAVVGESSGACSGCGAPSPIRWFHA